MKLKIGFWNIHGLGNKKYQNEDFLEIINSYDILCLTETWKEDGKSLPTPKGYKGKHHNRKEKHAKAKRNSGGILVLYKTEFQDHIKVINNKDENILWLKISKSYKGLGRDVLLGTVYISPSNSTVNKKDSATDTMEVLFEQIASFNEEESIIIGGDFNARIGNLSGRVTEEVELPGKREENTDIIVDKVSDISLRERVSEDKKINANGYDFADFCTSTNLCVLNGRTVGDLRGKYTFVGRNGCSTVDLVLASKKVRSPKSLRNFKVEDLNIFSDHRPVTVTLEKNNHQEEEEELRVENLERRIRTPTFNEIYSKNIDSEEVGEMLTGLTDKIEKRISEGSEIPDCISELERVMLSSMGGTNTSTGNKNCQQKEIRNRPKRKKTWFNDECRKLKNGLKHVCKILNLNPTDGNIRRQYYDTKKKYKTLLKKKKIEFEQKRIEEMELSAYKGKDFWKDFKKIRNPINDETLPNPKKIQSVFENLYKETEENTIIPETEKQYIPRVNLSKKITLEEIKKHLKILKRRKACGKDGILNEMLIFANEKLINIFKTIFNSIIDKEEYPEMWNYSLTQLIFKEGDRDDPGNYRGIALTSNLGNLFNALMNSRIYAYLEENGIIRREQGGGVTKLFRIQFHIFGI